MSDSAINLDVIKLIKEVSKQGIQNFELEYGDLKIKLSGEKVVEQVKTESLPEASSEQIDEIEQQEQKTIVERIKEKDEDLLNDLDYLSPELAGELKRSNIIKIGDDGGYEYVEKESINA
jgi:hypothetical protein